MASLMVRYGPAPENTAGPSGDLDANFTALRVVALADCGGEAAVEGYTPEFRLLVEVVWEEALKEGHGHVLIGRCDSFRFVSDEAFRGCGMSAIGFNETEGRVDHIVPFNYRCVFAVARSWQPDGGWIDLAVDYRGETPVHMVYAVGLPAGAEGGPPAGVVGAAGEEDAGVVSVAGAAPPGLDPRL